MLLATAAGDELVVPSQMVLMAGALHRAGAPAPVVRTLAAGAPPPFFGYVCGEGATFFVHACVTDRAYRDYLATEAVFMAGV